MMHQKKARNTSPARGTFRRTIRHHRRVRGRRPQPRGPLAHHVPIRLCKRSLASPRRARMSSTCHGRCACRWSRDQNISKNKGRRRRLLQGAASALALLDTDRLLALNIGAREGTWSGPHAIRLTDVTMPDLGVRLTASRTRQRNRCAQPKRIAADAYRQSSTSHLQHIAADARAGHICAEE